MAISLDEDYGPVPWQYNLIGLENVPNTGPIMLVAAPHSNEIVDVVLIVSVLYNYLKLPISFVIAQRSMRRKFVGLLAAGLCCIRMNRVWDSSSLGSGKIFAPNFRSNPHDIKGRGTRFDQEAEVGDWIMIVVDGKRTLRAKVAEIRGPQELYLEASFLESSDFSTSNILKVALANTTYYLASNPEGSDLMRVTSSVSAELKAGSIIGVFPEGHSHDQPNLIPFKTGRAVTALSYLDANHDPNFRIVPCALHQANGHRFRSRAGVEFGQTIRVPSALVEKYTNGDKKEAAEKLKDLVYGTLKTLTLTDSSASLLETTQTMRELYHGQSGRCSLRQRTVLNKQILETLSSKRGGAGVDSLVHRVDQYRFQLRVHGLRHHHVKYAVFNLNYSLVLLLCQLCILLPAILATIPRLVLFAPVLTLSYKISGNKRRQALKNSPFKLKGTDIISSWKMLVAIAVTPCLYSIYFALMTYWAYDSRWRNMLPSYIPTHMVPFLGFSLLLTITIVSLYTGEFAVDVLKSPPPPFLIPLRPGGTRLMKDLFEQQRKLTREVKMFIDSSIVNGQGI